MTKIKLIALDMDGTLLNNDHDISGETIEAINYARNKGVKVMIATGRPYSHCHPYAKQLDLDTYIAVSNGAEIWDMDENLLVRKAIHHEKMEQLWQVGERLDLPMWAISTEDVFYRENPPQAFHAETWLKIGYDDLTDEMKDRLLHELQYFEGELELTNSYTHNIEVNKAGVNKADAIRFICDKEDILMEEVLVAGDGLNDRKMIEQAGIGIAMGNAQDVLKQVADDVTGTNDEHGVAAMIRKYI